MDEIIKLLKVPAKAVLTLHRNPDPDSIGSNLALYHILSRLGHQLAIYSHDAPPQSLLFLPGSELINVIPADKIPWHNFDVYWALDLAASDRVGETSIPSTLTTVVIDHHISNAGWGSHNSVVPDAASTASVLLDLFRKAELPIDQTVADALMMGLAGDTGFFRFAQSPQTFRDAATLLDSGADYGFISSSILNQLTPMDIAFIAEGLKNMRVLRGRYVIVPISYDRWRQFNDTGELGKSIYIVDYLNRIQGTECGVLLLEYEPGHIRVQLRSRTAYDVSELAAKLGGGGHRAAAGAELHMSLSDALSEVEKHL